MGKRKDWHEKYFQSRKAEELSYHAESIDLYWAALGKICDSPIEQALGFALQMTLTEALIPERYPVAYLSIRPYKNWPAMIDDGQPRIAIFPQSQVGTYRADFLILCECNDVKFWIVVECDGHDFHERTKEQAKRDRARDRWMTANNISVLRFTGSEIYADPSACANQVADFISNKFGEF